MVCTYSILPSFGLSRTSVLSPCGLVTTMDVSGVTKPYFRDSFRASFFASSFSEPDNCSLWHTHTHAHTQVYSNTTHAVLTLVCCHAWIIKLTTQFTTTKWQRERWRRKLLNLKWLWSLTLCPGAVWRWGRPRLAAFGCQTPWHWSPWWHSCQQTPLFCFSVVAQSSVSQQKCFKLIRNMDPSSPK